MREDEEEEDIKGRKGKEPAKPITELANTVSVRIGIVRSKLGILKRKKQTDRETEQGE